MDIKKKDETYQNFVPPKNVVELPCMDAASSDSDDSTCNSSIETLQFSFQFQCSCGKNCDKPLLLFSLEFWNSALV